MLIDSTAIAVCGPALIGVGHVRSRSMEQPGVDLDRCSVPELLQLSREILRELRTRGIVRSSNAPAGDYAELLVQRATRGDLAPKSQKSWDVMTPNDRRLQVKARVLTPENSWEFDELAVVLFARRPAAHGLGRQRSRQRWSCCEFSRRAIVGAATRRQPGALARP
jgi:hypothetical protein